MKSFKNMGKLTGPYQDDSTNLIYNWLFCDNINLFKENISEADMYPWAILLAEEIDIPGLQKLITDTMLETRAKILAYNQLVANDVIIEKKVLLAVIVEVGLDDGLDVLASYKDGTARYINQSGKIIVWEAADEISGGFTKELFANSIPIIKQTGPWNDVRRPHPANGMARISFLVSDGLYFGEAPMNALFNDPLARPALLSATALMQFLTGKVLGTATN